MAKDKAPQIITPKFRVSFPSIFKPTAFEEQEPKYSVQMLFDKSTDLKPLKLAVKAVLDEKFPKGVPKKIFLPFKDGSEKELEGYENTIVVNASSKFQPGLVGPDRQAIISEDDFYAGCYARAQIQPHYWEVKSKQGVILKQGVSFYLNNVQKLADGERFGGKRTQAEDIFDSVEDTGSDDASNYSDDELDFL